MKSRTLLFLSCLLLTASTTVRGASSAYLIPIAQTEVPGAYGSHWVVDVYAHNHGDQILWITNTPICQLPAVHACDAPIGPRSTVKIPVFPPFASDDRYTIYGVVEGDPSALTLTSYVRNIAPSAASLGTAIPVPGLDSFRLGSLHIAPVPLNLEYRLSLRAYSFPERLSEVKVEIWKVEPDGLREIQLLASFSVPATPDGYYPRRGSYFETHDIGSRLPDAGLNAQAVIRISAPSGASSARLWALATVTNNATQHVTVFTP